MRATLILSAAAMLAATVASGQMFAQRFGATAWSPLRLGPVAWYQAEDNALDSSGNGYNGTWSGTASYIEGPIGLAFDTASQTVSAASVPLASNITVAAWVKWQSSATGRRLVGSSELAYQFRVGGSGNLGWNLWNSDGARREVTFGALATNTWHMLVGTYDGSSCVAYVAGLPVANGAQSGNIASASSFVAGNIDSDASIDDVLIFNRALSADEIQTLYQKSVQRLGEAWAWKVQ